MLVHTFVMFGHDVTPCLPACSRESAVRGLLCRHVELGSGEMYVEREELLREKLHVPQEWIHSAKVGFMTFLNHRIK